MLWITLPENTSMTSNVLFPNADTKSRLRFASAVKWSSRPATLGTGISSSSCSGAISRACCAVVDDLALLEAREMNPINVATPIASTFLMFPPPNDFSSLLLFPNLFLCPALGTRFVNQNRSLILVTGRRRNVITIEFGRPEGGASSWFRRNSCNLRIVVRILLPVDIHEAEGKSSSTRYVNAPQLRVEINAIHPVHCRKTRDLFTRRRIHGDHLWRYMRTEEQAFRRFVERRIARALAADRPGGNYLSFFRVNHLDLAGRRNQNKQRVTRFVQQELRGMRRNLHIGDLRIFSGINDSDFAVIPSRVFAPVAYIQQLAAQVVRNTIRTKFKLNGVERRESIAAKDANHSIIAARNEKLVECRNVGDSLRLPESRNPARPLSRLQVHHLHRAIFKAGDE